MIDQTYDFLVCIKSFMKIGILIGYHDGKIRNFYKISITINLFLKKQFGIRIWSHKFLVKWNKFLRINKFPLLLKFLKQKTIC